MSLQQIIDALYLLVADSEPADLLERACELLGRERGLQALQWVELVAEDEAFEFFNWLQAPDGAPQQAAVPATLIFETCYRSCTHRFALSAAGLGSPAVLPADWSAVLDSLVRVVHLMRRVELRRTLAKTADADNVQVGCALLSSSCAIEYADDKFRAQVLAVIPDWDGLRFPIEFEWSEDIEYSGLLHAGLHFRIYRIVSHYRVYVRPERMHPRLTRRELEVARLAARGMTFKQIGNELGIAAPTASTHLYKVYDKLSMSRRSDLLMWINRHDDA